MQLGHTLSHTHVLQSGPKRTYLFPPLLFCLTRQGNKPGGWGRGAGYRLSLSLSRTHTHTVRKVCTWRKVRPAVFVGRRPKVMGYSFFCAAPVARELRPSTIGSIELSLYVNIYVSSSTSSVTFDSKRKNVNLSLKLLPTLLWRRKNTVRM